MTVDFTWLESNVLKTELTPDERQALASITEITFTKGEQVLKAGDEGGSLYIIKSGEVSVEDNNRYEGRIAFVTLGEGDLIGELSFLSGRRVSADVKAESEVVLYKFKKEQMLELMMTHQKLALSIMNLIINHEAKLLLNMRRTLVPMLRRFKEKASKLPLAVKLAPVVFILIYIAAFLYISYKDFSY